MQEICREIQARLLEMQDLEYRDFHGALMPTIEKERIIGIRVPKLRRLAKELAGNPDIGVFLKELPHTYYEENNVHAFLIEQTKDYETCLAQVEEFLPFVDNWATCDMMVPKVFGKHKKEFLDAIRSWLASDKTYTVRFGVGMLMRFYLDADFQPEYLDMVAALRSQEYYVNMMIAWYFATALAKQYEAVLPCFEEQHLDVWTHNKALQKARESCRITPEQKEYLNTLKIKVKR